jgi:signal transduction histidine kinase
MTLLTSPQVYVEGLSTAETLSVSAVDIVTYSLIVIFIIWLIWLSNRNIRISKESMNSSEKMLEAERNSFERRISKRTVEFVRAEEQRMIELQRNAEFGKLSQGLFHDLISPLSSVSLYAQQLDDGHFGGSEKTKEMVRTVIESSRRMNAFMESMRRSLGNETTSQNIITTKPENISQNLQDNVSTNPQIVQIADLQKEIDIVLDILGYKARMAGVQIKVHQKKPVYLNIHPVRLHQLLVNLISNAIDACIQACYSTEKSETIGNTIGKSDHVVTISVIKKNSNIELSVSDTGCGISAENQSQLFRDQFTTKKNGSGIGVMTMNIIVKQDLKGTIEVTSEEGKGARFVIKIPVNTNKKYA